MRARRVAASLNPALNLRSVIFSLFAALFLFPVGRAFASDTLTLSLFGPESFYRSAGTSFTRTFTVPSTQGAFNLHIVNGDGAGHNGVSSGTVKVNGTTVVKSNQLNQQVLTLDKPLTNLVNGSNTLIVTISSNSQSSAYLTVSITGSYLLNITITSPPAGSEIQTDHTAVSGTYAAYTSNVAISVNGVAASFAGGVFTANNVPLASGANSLTATITTGEGIQDNDAISVTSNSPPVADAGADRNVMVGQQATLDGRASYDRDEDLITYNWSLLAAPVGSVATLDNGAAVLTSFVPDLPGAYVAALTVDDGTSNSLPDNVAYTAAYPNVAPTAHAGRDQSVLTGTLVTLDGTGSFDPDTDPLTYFWEFLFLPEGSQATLDDPFSPTPGFVADQSGEYVAGLTVNDGLQNSFPDNVVVVAATPNPPPVAHAGWDNTASRNTLIHLDGRQSYDPNGDPLSFWWSVVARPAGSVSPFDNAALPTPAILADREGYFVFRLWVYDGQHESGPDTVVITSVNDPPVADAGPDETVAVNTVMTLNGGGSADPNGDPITYSWSVQSAPEGSAAAVSNPSISNPLFMPDLRGSYTIRLIVNDGRVDSTPDTTVITAKALVVVPNVTGLPQANAEAAIVGAGLVTGTVTTANSVTVPVGSVISQNPAGGTFALEGSSVALEISLGPRTVAVPNVVGLSQPSAQTAIVDATLAVGVPTWAYDNAIPAGSIISQDPAGGSSVYEGTPVALVISLGSVAIPTVMGMPQIDAEGAIVATGYSVGAVTTAYSSSVEAGRVLSQSPVGGTSAPLGSAVALVVSLGPAPITVPPDPATVAPPVDPTVATDLASATEFLYSGANPIQTGVAPGTIDRTRIAVLRGRVKNRDETPLSGVLITVVGHPEFGQTVTRSDGMFDMAVNGGSLLTVSYEKPEYLPARRKVNAPWQDYAVLPDAVMIAHDNQVTAVTLNGAGPAQVARGSNITDADGTRRSTLLFPRWTQGSLVFGDGSSRLATTLNVRASEYTVGSNGPNAMPAALPPASGYTYAVELSADEAVVAGAADITFNQPIVHYVENFLGFPVGGIVPVGYYNRKSNAWLPSDNGRVIKILSITGGMADIDSDGNGLVDNAAVLAALGVTDTERQQLATLYGSGTTLWRVPITHFTPFDCNWPWGPPPDATAPNQPPPKKDEPNPCPNIQTGSIIECENQVLGESADVAGTPFSLHYRSSRVPGRVTETTLDIPLAGTSVPASLKRIELEVQVTGRHFASTYPALANQVASFTWDGRDGYGRRSLGYQPVTVRIGYVYDGVYLDPAVYGRSFADWGGAPITGLDSRQEVTVWQIWQTRIQSPWIAEAQRLGGWTLDVHHGYDPVGRVLYQGDGIRRGAEETDISGKIIATAAGNGGYFGGGDPVGQPATQVVVHGPQGVAVGADGTYYVADLINRRVLKVGADGIVTANIVFHPEYPLDVAVAPDGSLYVAVTLSSGIFGFNDPARIVRIAPDNTITTVAGNGTVGSSGDGGPATQAALGAMPNGIALGADGSVYIADSFNSRIRRVGPDGIINTVAGSTLGFSGDGGRATQAKLNQSYDVAVGPDGSLYIADTWNNRIRKVWTDGIITTVAGGGSPPDGVGDGGPATEAALRSPHGVEVGPDGTLYIADSYGYRVRRVRPDGTIITISGNGVARSGSSTALQEERIPATQGTFKLPEKVALGPDGSLYVSDYSDYRVRKIFPYLPGVSVNDTAIASADGAAVHIFSGYGKLQRTVDTFTGATRYEFVYNAQGLLSQVIDGNNNVTTIERDGAGNPQAIVAPGGQRTSFTLDPNGYLATIADPAGNTTQYGYTTGGLLTSLVDARLNGYSFHYDTLGRLDRDENAEGGFTTLVRTDTANGFVVTTGTASDRTTTYDLQILPTEATQKISTWPTGATTQQVTETNWSSTTAFPDATVRDIDTAPDPRWGMAAPFASKTTVTTPGGLTATVAASRTAALSNPADPLSLTSQTDNVMVNGKTWSRTYSASTKRFTLTTPTGRMMVAGIDNQSRVVLFGLDPSVDNILVSYDPVGRLQEASQGGNAWTFGYDNLNRLTSVTDPLDNAVQYAYDDADRVSQVILPSGRTYNFGYDANGNRTSITMPSGVVHQLGYNKINLDNSYLPPSNPAYATGYNLDRQWVRTALPSGRAIDGAYDNGGRLHEVTYPEGAVTLSYVVNTDRVGTHTRTSGAGNQAIAFSYDGFLPTRIAYSGVANGEYRYAFDNNFLVTGVALDNVWTTVGHDNDGLLTQYGPFTITRNGPAGAPSNLTDNTLSVSYTYDSIGRLATRTHTVNSQEVYQLTLGYDDVGRIAQKIETVSGTAHTFDYTYDLDGQLFEVRRDGILVEQYGYDNNANRTSTLATTATYDDQDRLIEQGGLSYTFDVDGFLVQRGSDTFTYSARGELLSATVGPQTVTYQYDGTARRIARTDVAGTTQYLYGNPGNPFQVTATRDVAGNLTSYFYDVGGNLFAFERFGQWYYVATDKLGTPKVVSDSAGAIVKIAEYDAWGVKTYDSSPTFELAMGFAGGIEEPVTRTVRFGFRDYEPGTGRWAAKDPIFFRGGQANLYGYVGNSPISYFDRSGMGPIGDVGFAYPDVKPGQVFVGTLQLIDAATIAGTGIAATAGTCYLTGNPWLTAVVGAEMLPLGYAAYLEGKEGFHNIGQGLGLTGSSP